MTAKFILLLSQAKLDQALDDILQAHRTGKDYHTASKASKLKVETRRKRVCVIHSELSDE